MSVFGSINYRFQSGLIYRQEFVVNHPNSGSQSERTSCNIFNSRTNLKAINSHQYQMTLSILSIASLNKRLKMDNFILCCRTNPISDIKPGRRSEQIEASHQWRNSAWKSSRWNWRGKVTKTVFSPKGASVNDVIQMAILPELLYLLSQKWSIFC